MIMYDRTPVNVPLFMSDFDLSHLTETQVSAKRNGTDYLEFVEAAYERGDIENHSSDEEDPDFTKYPNGYWLGDQYTNVILATAYLAAKSANYVVLWDMIPDDNGDVSGWLVITDYETTSTSV